MLQSTALVLDLASRSFSLAFIPAPWVLTVRMVTLAQKTQPRPVDFGLRLSTLRQQILHPLLPRAPMILFHLSRRETGFPSCS